jgi:tripartite-type tricarboxylate transporter receptor subunit TctC
MKQDAFFTGTVVPASGRWLNPWRTTRRGPALRCRRILLRLLSILAFTLPITAGHSVAAETYPDRPIQLLVPFSAGSVVDILARGFADALGRTIGGSVIVSNQEGASGIVALSMLANARPDGYTLGFAPAGQITIQPHLKTGLAYKADSFEPICQTFENHFAVIVSLNSPYKDLSGLVEAAKQQPGKLVWGDVGTATVPDLQMHSLMKSAGAQMLPVPYRGYGQLLQDVIAGRIDAAVSAVGSFDGTTVRPLVVLTDARSPSFPDVPAVKELGYSVSVPGFGGLYAPRGIPDTVLSTLGQACAKIVQDAAFRQLVERTGSVLSYRPHDAFAQRLAEDSAEKAQLLKTLGINAN